MHLTNLRSRYNWDDKKDINDLKTYWLQMDAEAKDKMTKTDTVQVQVKEYLAELAEMEHHKLNCERQKKQFNTELEATRTSVSTMCVIVLDYKQNLELGHGPMEQDDTIYNIRPCTCVPCVVFLPDDVVIHCDFLSLVLTHDSEISAFVTRRLVDRLAADELSRDVWQSIQTISIWTDCGPHFRSEVYSWYCLYELPAQERKNVLKNLFGEKHGKNVSDTHGQKVDAYHDEYTQTETVKELEHMKAALLIVNKRVNEIRVDYVGGVGGAPSIIYWNTQLAWIR